MGTRLQILSVFVERERRASTEEEGRGGAFEAKYVFFSRFRDILVNSTCLSTLCVSRFFIRESSTLKCNPEIERTWPTV